MRTKSLLLMIVGLALISGLAAPTTACRCRRPGKSPGWWKHQFNAFIEEKGKPHVTWTQLEAWVVDIDGYYGFSPPWFFGYPLPPVTSLDYDESSIFTTDDAYSIFNDQDWNHMWTPLANWFNWASGRRPYW